MTTEKLESDHNEENVSDHFFPSTKNSVVSVGKGMKENE